MIKKWTLVASFLCLFGFAFGLAASDFGVSTAANPLQGDNETVTETATEEQQQISSETNLPNVDSATVMEVVESTGDLPPELQDIVIPEDYDKAYYDHDMLPDPQIALVVRFLNLTLLEHAKVNVTLSVVIRWTDAQLKFTPNSNITWDWKNAPLTALDHIWHPPIVIEGRRTRDHYLFDDISCNREQELDWKKWGEEVEAECVGCIRFRRTTKVTFQFNADKNYKFFPNDKRLITFWLEPTYDRLDWDGIPVRKADVYFESKEYKEDDTFEIRVASSKFTAALNENVNSTYFDINVLLNRRMESYIYKVYIPSGLFVVLSFLSMLLPTEVAGERVALCATTLLAVTVFYSEAPTGKAESYLRAIDMWLLGCTGYVFLILFQSIIIFQLAAKKIKKRKLKESGAVEMKQAVQSLTMLFGQMQGKLGGSEQAQKSAALEPTPQDTDVESKAQDPVDKEDEPRKVTKIAVMIDRLSLIFFVIILVVCNGIYWDRLLNSVQQTCDDDKQCSDIFVDIEE